MTNVLQDGIISVAEISTDLSRKYKKKKGGEVMRGDLLKTKIKDRGMKISYVAKVCHLSRAGFSKKLNGHSYFNTHEVGVMIELLGLSTEEVYAIFFNE